MQSVTLMAPTVARAREVVAAARELGAEEIVILAHGHWTCQRKQPWVLSRDVVVRMGTSRITINEGGRAVHLAPFKTPPGEPTQSVLEITMAFSEPPTVRFQHEG